MDTIISKEEQEYWSTTLLTETEIVGRAIGTMRSGGVARLTTKTLLKLIEQFEAMRYWNNFSNLKCVYDSYCPNENDEPHWLCSLQYVPVEVYLKMRELEVLHWSDGE